MQAFARHRIKGCLGAEIRGPEGFTVSLKRQGGASRVVGVTMMGYKTFRQELPAK